MNQLQQSLYRILEFLLAMSLLVIALVIVSLVVMRYCFNASITGANEFATIVFAYATAIGSAVAIGRDEHIAIDFGGRSVATIASTADLAAHNSVSRILEFGFAR